MLAPLDQASVCTVKRSCDGDASQWPETARELTVEGGFEIGRSSKNGKTSMVNVIENSENLILDCARFMGDYARFGRIRDANYRFVSRFTIA
jgi:hypothetical protein